MKDSFEGKEDMILEAIFAEIKTQTVHLIVEIKPSDMTFEEYNPNMITFKVNLWKEGIQNLEEKYLSPTLYLFFLLPSFFSPNLIIFNNI